VPHRASPTLEDVARAADVSRATASRALAGSASTPARARVHDAARQLGYSTNPVARALASGSGLRLAVVVHGRRADVLDDPYTDRVVAAAARAAAPQGVGVSASWLPMDRSAPRLLERLGEDRGVCGVILVNTTERVLAALPASLRGRVVSIGVGATGVPSFDVDNGGAATAILNHMYGTGRRRIAMVTGPAWLPCTARPVDAYRDLMAATGSPVRLVSGDFSAHSGHCAAAEIMRRWPDTDAVYAISDAPALGVLAALGGSGVDVPGDVAVAGFDDIPFAELSRPALTTASHPVSRIATAAAEAVLSGRPAPPVTSFASELIRRHST
jgi:DNA-binding LacI/PurR family transcriptional regulator